jgi:uncharacterized RDD family membrane protein YckC
VSAADTTGTQVCWNCRQPLPAGTQRCLYCGMPQDAQSAQLVVAPDGSAAPAPTAVPAAGTRSGTGPAVLTSGPRISPLGTAFAGRPAGVGARLAAFTIDVVIVAVVGVAVQVLLHSVLITAIAVGEVIVGFVVLQARTGLGPGAAMLRLRVARADRPFTPGVGRAAVRGLVTAAGALVVGLGAWFVELTAGFDATGRRRSWGDLAARTVVVAIPSRAERAALAGLPTPRAPAVPGSRIGARVPGAETPAVAPVAAAAAPAIGPMPGMSAPVVAAAPAPPAPPAPSAPAAPPPVAPAPTAITLPEPHVQGLPPVTDPDPLAGVEHTEVAGGLVAPIARPADPQQESEGIGDALLTFDTGQREQLPVPVVALLGRNPSSTEATDVLIAVSDPESTVSKTHVRLELTRAGTWVTDNSSTNGTDLLEEDGTATRLHPGVRTAVEDGARVRLGNRVFTISTLL